MSKPNMYATEVPDEGTGRERFGKQLKKQWSNFFQNYKPIDPRRSMKLKQDKYKENHIRPHYDESAEKQW